MKIIDKTPLLDEKGELALPKRIQGILKYGFNWPNELEAQKAIITFFDRQLEKGYTLIRNMTLGASGIVVPMILLGPAGIYVIYVTYLRGRYEARGNSWNEEAGDGYKPAAENLLQQTTRMANAVRKFIERQGVTVPVPVEPVLISGNPGLHIESVKPSIRVVMIDGIRSFVTGLSSTPPVLRPEAVHEFTERIVNPRAPRKNPPAGIPATLEEKTQPPQNVSRARAIFDASEEAKPFNPADFDFEMAEEEPAPDAFSSSIEESSPATPQARSSLPAGRVLGMTRPQLAVVVALGLALLCILAVFIMILINPNLLP